MKSLSLTIAERLASISIFNNSENKVATENLKVYLTDVDKFRLTSEDKEACGWTENKAEEDVKDSDGNVTVKKGDVTSMSWKPDAPEKTLEVDEFTRKFLEEKLKVLELSAADPFAGPVSTLIGKVC